MGSMSKSLAIVVVLSVIISTLIMVKPGCAQSTTKPSVPDFTVEPVGPSFDIPPTYSFNSSSGLFIVNEGYHFEFSTVKIVIKNQPFTNQTNIDFLYYNVRIRPHNYPDSYWQELYSAGYDGYPIQTSSDPTIIPISVEGTQALGTSIIPTGATTDIQVEAMIGYISRNNTMYPYPYPYVFFGETSGWSNTQTVTLPPKTPFTFPTPTSSPTLTPSPDLNPNSITLPVSTFIVIIAMLTLSLMTLTALLLRRPRKSKETVVEIQSARNRRRVAVDCVFSRLKCLAGLGLNSLRCALSLCFDRGSAC
jgi:hypothetical protein